MGQAVRQRLAKARLFADFAHRGGIGASGAVGHGPLGLKDLFEHAVGHLRCRRAVDVKHALLHLDLITRQTDQPLDHVGPVHRMAEHHHIAALGVIAQDTARNRANAKGTGIARIAIGHLVDEDEVADQQRGLHRLRGNPEGLKEQCAEGPRDQQRPDHSLDGLANSAFGFCHDGRFLPGSRRATPALHARRARGSQVCAGLGHRVASGVMPGGAAPYPCGDAFPRSQDPAP